MQQQLQVSLTVPVPEGYVLVNKVEYEELKEQELSGRYWTMKRLEEHVNKKADWIKENILYPSRFRKILDSENGGFVYYPKNIGEKWSFHAIQMVKFLDNNFSKIHGSK